MNEPTTLVIGAEPTQGELTPAVEHHQQAGDTEPRRALVVGEALIDVVVRPDGSRHEHPGGSPMNVAIGLGRLGRGVDLLTWIGRDAPGAMITDHLVASDVTLVPGSDEADRTSVALATISDDGSPAYQFDLAYQIPDQWASPPAAPIVVHTGSIATVVEPGAHDIPHLIAAHRASATITYDPNLRPSLMPPPEVSRPIVERLVALADVVKVSDEDLAWLTPDDPLDVARAWLALGPVAVIVTLAGAGAVAVTEHGQIAVEAPSVEVVDTVGAGDSFMSGLIDGLWSANLLGADRRTDLSAAGTATWTTVLERCVRIAALTVSRPGADPPSAADLA